MRSLSFALFCASLWLVGCAPRSTLPAPPPARAVEQEPAFVLDPMPTSYGSEIGGLNQEDVEEQFLALQPAFMRCVQRAAGDLRTLGGRVSIRMRLDPGGRVRWVYLTDSTLGDRRTERCLLDEIRHKTWPRPLSGDGLAESTFEVEPSEPPASWPRFKASALAERARRATRACWDGTEGRFRATAYVAPGGDVLAAGVAPPDEQGELVSDCISDALQELKLANLTVAQRATAKVSFTLP